MKKFISRQSEKGMSTAEYAVGTVGACSIGGLLVKLAQTDWFSDLMKGLFERIPDILPF